MEIKVGGVYRTKDDVHCFSGSVLPKGVECKVIAISHLFTPGRNIVEDSLLKQLWNVSSSELEEVENVEKVKNLASKGQERLEIDIAFVGNSTTAYLIKKGVPAKQATAYCAPDDKFSIEVGANLALERLFEKKKGLTPLTETIISLADMTGGKSLLDFIDKDKTGTEIDRLENKSDLCKIADHYGLECQGNKLMEETGELITASAKPDIDHLVEEMADVAIMIEQVVYLLKKENLFAETREKKIKRQLKRIEEEEMDGERNCLNCKNFPVAIHAEPCKNCFHKSKYPNWEKDEK